MKIAVVGTGYVGLVTGAGFSDFGHDVTCVDIDAARIAKLRSGDVPFYEPGLHDLIRRNTGLGRLRFTTSTAEAVAGSQLVFIAVGTPSSEDGSADLAHVLEAAGQIGAALTQFTVVVTKSTVPVGTADRVRATLGKTATQAFAVASNPEFLKEGDAVNDFLKPARVVVGADEPRAIELLRDLYRGMLRTNDRIQVMDVRSAELTKYAANCMLATRISFMNELARLCEATGADIEAVRKGIGSDPRIGNKFLFAGAGFGGSCFRRTCAR
jgi:UDPglucose 6-dehydrogenase